MMAGLLIGAEPAPFELYGVDGGGLAPKALATVGRTAAPDGGMRLQHVALGHGDRSDPSQPWVLVGVVGPLHWATDGRIASMDPLPMIASELLHVAGGRFASVDDVDSAAQAVIERGFTPAALEVDGIPRRFGLLHEGEPWAAVRHIEPVHVLYVVARGVSPSDVRLRRLHDLGGYSTG